VRHEYRAADGSTELVPLQNLALDPLFVVEECVGVKVLVAQIIERRAVQRVLPLLVTTLTTPPPLRPYSAE